MEYNLSYSSTKSGMKKILLGLFFIAIGAFSLFRNYHGAEAGVLALMTGMWPDSLADVFYIFADVVMSLFSLLLFFLCCKMGWPQIRANENWQLQISAGLLVFKSPDEKVTPSFSIAVDAIETIYKRATDGDLTSKMAKNFSWSMKAKGDVPSHLKPKLFNKQDANIELCPQSPFDYGKLTEKLCELNPRIEVVTLYNEGEAVES
uniref:hypothetical protein n=1 Tax=Thaumasiovibrio occultus TaxID=1891184 RepID=UPI000B35F52A|nr:hypothetical protein [Thaumasiovibrio occultus]